MRSRIQVVEMSFLRRVSGLRDRVRSSDIRERLRVEAAAPPRREEPVEVVRASCKDASRTPPCRRYFGHVHPGGDPGADCLGNASGSPLEELVVEVAGERTGERTAWASLLRLLPPRPGPG
ncbi:hypothetical protein L3Q82_003737 [Scortum barcoo]|uniref:Uncharacterized protein n=1 Tax=Scortum barcoo TaxID=214431 RepID=A0ACB8X758_9TELE|nr:hypothetical protein L3Q82_003737 [Scortum barcoo]